MIETIDLKSMILQSKYWEEDEIKLIEQLDLENPDWLQIRMIIEEQKLKVEPIFFEFRLKAAIKDIEKRFNIEERITELQDEVKALINDFEERLGELEDIYSSLKHIKSPRSLEELMELKSKLDDIEDEIESLKL